MKNAWRVIQSALALAAALGVAGARAAPKLPLEAFAAPPVVQQVLLSPDGQKVAMMVNNEGASMIVVQDLAPQGKRVNIMSTDNRDYSFRWFRWVDKERIVVATMFPSKRRTNAISNVGGVLTHDTRLLAARADGSQVINLMKPTSFAGELQPQIQDQVIDFEPDDGKSLLLTLEERGDASDPAVYGLNVQTGARSHAHNSREKFRSWMVDRNHRVRLGVRRERAEVEIHACDPDGSNWRKLWSYRALARDRVTPLGFGLDPNELYLIADHGGRRALFTVDLRDPALKRTLKLASEKRDISGSLVYSRKTGEAVGLYGGAVDAAEDNYWDKDRRELVGFIDQALPKRFNRIVSMSADETRYIVRSRSDQTPVEFYLGDDRANTLALFALGYPKLAARDMVPKQAFSIKARDGLELPAFLSLPQGAEPKSLPAVLLVHGGPQDHVDMGFDPWVQFLANRGYAVLEVNFRGSTGYGSDLMQAGMRRWGLEMQDDLSDALQWAIARGTVDPKRVCIVGASYGGYAALMGVAKTPELYRCAVSFAGVSDLPEMLHDTGYYENLKEVAEIQVGSRDKEMERLKATSPRYLAARIQAPVLLAHGIEDRTVPVYQGELMASALTAAGKPHRFIKLERGEHDLNIYANGLLFFREMEAFLAQHLGAGAVPAR